MQRSNQKETELDLEYNTLRGQITNLRETAQDSHQLLSNFSRKITTCSKRDEISEAYRAKAEEEVRRLISTMEVVLKTLKR